MKDYRKLWAEVLEDIARLKRMEYIRADAAASTAFERARSLKERADRCKKEWQTADTNAEEAQKEAAG